MLNLVASCLLGQGFGSSLETRLERVLGLLEDEILQEDDFSLVRGARAGQALDPEMLTGWRSIVYKCHERAIVAPCPDLKTKKICQAGKEARQNGGGMTIKNAKCVWCENGCTDSNPGVKCEPKNWLEKQGNRRDYEICPASDNPYHTYIDYNLMDTNVPLKSQGGTGGYSKCYSENSCMQMLMIEKGWITSPTCTTCGRRRADEEYVTMNLEVPASLFESDPDRRRFHNPTFQMEEMQVTSNIIKYLRARDGTPCRVGDAITNTARTCALNADICVRMECDNAGYGKEPDWTQNAGGCGAAEGFIRAKCVV